MYLPEINHLSQSRYSLSGFGGINRRETAEVGEFVEAVNLSSDEYPIIMPRKRYDVGLFQKVALMWHNNDRDMALVPAFDIDKINVVTSQSELDMFLEYATAGEYVVVAANNVTVKVNYTTDEETESGIPDVSGYELAPGKACLVTVEKYHTVSECIVGDVTPITETSHVTYMGNSIDLPTIVAFKDPVCANIGTSTVICDEINGMWVLEYDKDTDSYTYSKVQNKYEVSNETDGTYITGGSYCHVRCRYEDDTEIAGVTWAKDEETLDSVRQKNDNVNCLVAYGTLPYTSCEWFRITNGGNLEPVDFVHYEFCTLEGSMMFLPGDYVEIKMSGIWKRTPDLKEELAGLDGYYDVVRTRANDDGVKYSLILKGAIRGYGTMDTLTMDLGDAQKEGERTRNNVFLSDGMTIERKAPENVRFICSHMNRIWCNNGNNEIMCCARGNPFVWYRYEGNALDSWATTIGGDGAFTGCINYGYPLFFKDNRMFRMTGSRPSNFGYDEYSMRGIKSGCHDSAVIVNDVLYYQSIDGIYAYASSTPVCVSDKVYRGTWHNGRACRFRDKYYITVTESNGDNTLYCYDTKSGIWHIEELNGAAIRYMYPGNYLADYEEAVMVYTEYTDKEGHLYATVESDGTQGHVGSLSEEEKSDRYYAGYLIYDGEPVYKYGLYKEAPTEWSFLTTDLLASEIEYKYLKGIYVNCRIYTEEENGIEISVQYDGDEKWTLLASIGPQRGESRSVWYNYPLEGKRCENLKIKAEGVGKAVIYSIVLEFEKGSTKK